MPNARDYTGYRNGRLVALRPTDGRQNGKVIWQCRCDCGTDCLIPTNHLANKQRWSCGCGKRKGSLRVPKTPIHGHYVGGASRTYHSWSSMRSRCLNPRVPDYHRYGGRGILVCERWNKFENFLADMGARPSNRTLDRIDVNGNYEPGNCRWATPEQQYANTRKARLITFSGKTQTAKAWSREMHICAKTIYARLNAGLSPEMVLQKRSQSAQRGLLLLRP